MTERPFSILTVGYGHRLISVLWNKIEERANYRISHVPAPVLFPKSVMKDEFEPGRESLYYLAAKPNRNTYSADLEYLASLEGEGGPTIHNVILGDAHLSDLDYSNARDYLCEVARRLEEIFTDAKPDVVLSGFDGFVGTLSMLVCRKLNLQWFGLVYTPIPHGMTGFSATNNNFGTRSFSPPNAELTRKIAKRTIEEFEGKLLSAYSPTTENSILNIIKFLPLRFKNAKNKLAAVTSGTHDRYTQRSFFESTREYLRRRRNFITNKKVEFAATPPATPFVFFGFHMQPEMGIDVWAPYYSNQAQVVEFIARSTPPTHKVMVKLHRIDADNWSNDQLLRIEKMPGVVIVSPTANTQDFVSKAELIFSIQGTIAFEASMIGIPVITFGETMYEDMPTVTRVENLTDLPSLVRRKLKESRPARSEILAGLEKVLSRFAPGLYNNWEIDPSDEQLTNFIAHLECLRRDLLHL